MKHDTIIEQHHVLSSLCMRKGVFWRRKGNIAPDGNRSLSLERLGYEISYAFFKTTPLSSIPTLNVTQ